MEDRRGDYEAEAAHERALHASLEARRAFEERELEEAHGLVREAVGEAEESARARAEDAEALQAGEEEVAAAAAETEVARALAAVAFETMRKVDELLPERAEPAALAATGCGARVETQMVLAFAVFERLAAAARQVDDGGFLLACAERARNAMMSMRVLDAQMAEVRHRLAVLAAGAQAGPRALRGVHFVSGHVMRRADLFDERDGSLHTALCWEDGAAAAAGLAARLRDDAALAAEAERVSCLVYHVYPSARGAAPDQDLVRAALEAAGAQVSGGPHEARVYDAFPSDPAAPSQPPSFALRFEHAANT